MNWLPVVERELRVAARKRSTFWLRVVAAGSWVVLGGGFLVVSAFGGGSGANLGAGLFQVLIWTALVFALAACLEAARIAGGERLPTTIAPGIRPPPIVAARAG